MKKLLFLFPIVLLLCGCMPKQSLNDSFLPVVLAMEDNTFYVGGYDAPDGSEEAPTYQIRQIEGEHIVTAFEANKLSMGTLGCMAVSTDSLEDGLYPVYAPFLYNDDATEGMYLSLFSDTDTFSEPPAEDADDLHTYLVESDFPTPSLIAYDIAMRTPFEGSILPVIGLDENKHYQIQQIGVLRDDRLQGYMTVDTYPYINLFNKKPVRLFLPYETSNDSGLVRLDLTSDIALELGENESFIFHITVFADGMIAAQETSDQDLRIEETEIAHLQNNVSQTLLQNCKDTLHQALSCKTDVFGFTRLVLATDRSYSPEQLEDIFLNASYAFQIHIKIRNVTQIH